MQKDDSFCIISGFSFNKSEKTLIKQLVFRNLTFIDHYNEQSHILMLHCHQSIKDDYVIQHAEVTSANVFALVTIEYYRIQIFARFS